VNSHVSYDTAISKIQLQMNITQYGYYQEAFTSEHFCVVLKFVCVKKQALTILCSG
jgi:hypothetical protein